MCCFQEHLNVFIGVYLSINIENFTNNLIHKESRLLCQLSKLLKSYVFPKGMTLSKDSRRRLSNHIRLLKWFG